MPLLQKYNRVSVPPLAYPNALSDSAGKAGGKAAAVICSAEDGEAIVKAALEKFGGVHVLIANAGILRDKSFQAMTEQEWDAVIAVHLRSVLKSRLVHNVDLAVLQRDI
jgi:NAD(P)-dependent dehydrogenase (short-subunit alcohol dehydrogenase family)